MVASFTKAAAIEIAGRDLPIPRRRVGTLHSFCYHALGQPEIADTPKWLAVFNESRHEELQLSHGKSLDDPYGIDTSGKTMADRWLAEYSRLRTQLRSIESQDPGLKKFAEIWEGFKEEHGLLDFTDLIIKALEFVEYPPYVFDVAFVDETQDMAPAELALIRKWGCLAKRFILAGDDDQCQPGSTMVLLQGGKEKRMDLLNPNKDKIVCYDRRGSTLVGLRKGYSFRKQKRYHSGTIFTVHAGNFTTSATAEHRWLVKFLPRARRLFVVYLMRRGDWWRVGRCRLIRSDGICHLGHRARLESADEAWVLKATENKEEAWRYENYIAIEYGIPQTSFNPSAGACFVNAALIKRLFASIDMLELRRRAYSCLRDHELSEKHPLWSREKAYERRGGSSILLLESCNLISGYMQMPVRDKGRSVKWTRFNVTIDNRSGFVYSLNITPHHTYVANRIVTHNCIYHFRGATPDAFLDPPLPEENYHYMSQSYRLPRKIKERADTWIKGVARRHEKPFDARGEDGEVTHSPLTINNGLWTAQAAWEHAKNGSKVMILTTCSFMLNSILRNLKIMGIPFHNPFRKQNGAWNPWRGGIDRLKAYLTDDVELHGQLTQEHTWSSVWKWLEVIDYKKSGIPRGAKNTVRGLAKDEDTKDKELTPEDWAELGISPPRGDLQWLRENLLTSKTSLMSYALHVARRQGMHWLRNKPKIIVGTIHSVKGAESDVVYLFPDVSTAAVTEVADQGTPAKDALRRVYYVGMTRARQKLYLCQPANHRMSVESVIMG